MSASVKEPQPTEKKNRNIMYSIASFIVTKRVIFYLVFLAAIVYCALSVNKVKVNSDMTALLPKDTETRRGLTIMEEEFRSYGSASVMVGNITYARAEALSEQLQDIDGVASVAFDDTRTHYADSSALYSISFEEEAEDPITIAAMQQVQDTLAAYDTYSNTTIGCDVARS